MSENLIKEYEKIILEDPEIRSFINNNKISKTVIENNLARFINQYENNKKCSNCPGLHSCTMDVYAHSTVLSLYNDTVNLVYYPCKYALPGTNDKLEMLYFPKNEFLLNKEIDFNNSERVQIFKEISRFVSNYQNEEFTKGIYLYGEFGTGKTQILLNLASLLSKRNTEVLFVYYPDLVRNLKSLIGNPGFETLIQRLKTVEILMLDDVGAENNTEFIRDEVLGPILQYRMMAYLPVFMTSNYSLPLLQEHFSFGKEEVNKIKSSRIIERIRAMMEIVELKGKKYR